MSATFLVTSVPVMPMPTPISADLIEGASLTPSPVMAVMAPSLPPGIDDAHLVLRLHAGIDAVLLHGLRPAPHRDRASSSRPVMAWLASVMMPSSLAMATAVSLWSPVIITGRIPAARHCGHGRLDLRTHRVDHAAQTDEAQILLQSPPAPVGRARLSYSRCAAASTRRALSAMALFCGQNLRPLRLGHGQHLRRFPYSGCSGAAPRRARPWCTG